MVLQPAYATAARSLLQGVASRISDEPVRQLGLGFTDALVAGGATQGSVAKPDIGHTRAGMDLRLGGRSEESCSEVALRAHVIRWGTDNLSLADHRHDLVARNRP